MEFITRQKFSLRNQPFVSLYGTTVLLVEPEAEACALYSKQFQGVNMNVITCGTLPEMLDKIGEGEPDIIILNPSYDVAQGLRFVELVKKQYPGIPIITIGQSILEAQLDAIMRAGVSFHINRQFTQPRDILLAVEQVLMSNLK